jgi:hypothetical protein
MLPGGRKGTGATGPSRSAAGRSVIVVAIAVILGLLILNRGFGSDSTDGSSTASTTATTKPVATSASAATTTTIPTTTTTVSLATAAVLVANGAGVKGAAGKLTDNLAVLGIKVVRPAVDAKSQQAATVVYYVANPGADAQAKLLATTYLGASVQTAAMPAVLPVNDLNGATHVIVIGTDLGNQAANGQIPLRPAATTATSAAAATPATAATAAPAQTTTTVKG